MIVLEEGIVPEKEKEKYEPVQTKSLSWKVVDDYMLNTPLGVHTCRAEVLDSDDYMILKPIEGVRLAIEQVKLFCDWVIETQGLVLGKQLKYLLEVFDLSQMSLAEATQISQSTVSQLIKGQSDPSKQISRRLALFFKQFIEKRGFTPCWKKDPPECAVRIDHVKAETLSRLATTGQLGESVRTLESAVDLALERFLELELD